MAWKAGRGWFERRGGKQSYGPGRDAAVQKNLAREQALERGEFDHYGPFCAAHTPGDGFDAHHIYGGGGGIPDVTISGVDRLNPGGLSRTRLHRVRICFVCKDAHLDTTDTAIRGALLAITDAW